MSLRQALRQMPAQAGRVGVARAVKPRVNLPATKLAVRDVNSRTRVSAAARGADERDPTKGVQRRCGPTKAQRAWTDWTSTRRPST